MKRFPLLRVLVAGVGVGIYFFCYHRAMASVVVVTPDGTDAELGWLKREFALDPARYEKVVALHHAYSPVCADHCTRYVAAHRRLGDLLKNNTSWSHEMDNAFAEQARIQGECHASMLKYA